MRIFDSFAIRDTAIKQPDPEVGWVDCSKITHLAFGVENDLNQNVSIQPIGRVGGAEGNLGSATTVNANSNGIVNVNLDSYWASAISVTITAASAPSSGVITVNAITREKADVSLTEITELLKGVRQEFSMLRQSLTQKLTQK